MHEAFGVGTFRLLRGKLGVLSFSAEISGIAVLWGRNLLCRFRRCYPLGPYSDADGGFATLCPCANEYSNKCARRPPLCPPDLVKAAVDGRLPHGMGVARLTDLPPQDFFGSH